MFLASLPDHDQHPRPHINQHQPTPSPSRHKRKTNAPLPTKIKKTLFKHLHHPHTMNIGDILLLKKGILGLSRDENVGIYLDREKGGKQYVYSVFTVRGLQKVRQNNVVKDMSGLRYRGATSDQTAMKRYLLEKVKPKLKGKHREQPVTLSPKNILREVDIPALWNAVADFMDWGEEKKQGVFPGIPPENWQGKGLLVGDISTIYFHPKIPQEEHAAAIRTILSVCENAHYGYFRRWVEGRKERFVPYSREEMANVENHVDRLHTLKGYFVEWVKEEVVASSGDGGDGEKSGGDGFYYDDAGKRHRRRPRERKVPKLLVEVPAELKLPGEMKNELYTLLLWSALYLKNASFNWRETGVSGFGLAGTEVRTIKGFDLEKYLHFFAIDIAWNPKLELPSALVELLLIFKRVTYREASQLLLGFFLTSGKIHFHLEFKEAHLKAAGMLPDTVREKELEGRRDLTALETYTIDPPDAKDFDDAISFAVLEAGDPHNPHGRKLIELWVHIADVTNYVRPGDIIDDEARFRATSVYLTTGVLPMLPHKLSNHLCSLVAGDIRLAVSTRLLFDAKTLDILEKEHVDSFIKVDENLSYDYVNQKMEEGAEPFRGMCEFAKALEEHYQRLDLDTPERKLRFTEDGAGFDISLKMASDATRMIENFMVVTNEAVAQTLSEANVPGLYRIHPLPERQRIERFNGMCGSLGYDDTIIHVEWERLASGEKGRSEETSKGGGGDILSALMSGGTVSLGGFAFEQKPEEAEQNTAEDAEGSEGAGSSPSFEPINPDDLEIFVSAFNQTLSAIKSRVQDIGFMLTNRLLGTMPRALYLPSNHGHFGLNSLSYCHFTSPIRRYPDILIHRALKVLIAKREGKRCPWDTPGADEIERMADICNEQAKAAEELERLMVDIALATRLSREKELREQTYHAMVSGLTPGSVFLNMDGFSEGRIPISHLSRREHLTLDEGEARVLRVDEVTGEEEEVLRLGQRIGCLVFTVDIGEGKIELSLKA